MPLDEDGRSGSGYDPKTRLDLPALQGGDTNSPITRGQLRDILKGIKDWSDRLPFGRVGFSVKMTPLDPVPVVSNEIASFDQLVEDSHSFHLTYLEDPRSVFQVPPGLGRVYNISYSMDFAVLELVTDSFVTLGPPAIQEWTAPAGLLGNQITVEARGGVGSTTGVSSPPWHAGLGAIVGATFHGITPGAVYDVLCGMDGGLGGTQTTTGFNGGNGGGSAQLRPDGAAITSALIVAGGGGGTGGGTLSTHANAAGDGGYVAGGTGNGYTLGVDQLLANGGTQSAGGTAAGFNGAFKGENGDTDGQGFGGDGPDSSGSTFVAGGGGGGWHGGGSGAFATPNPQRGGAGGGGSSKVNGGTGITHTDGAHNAQAELDISYYESTAAADTDVVTRVWVAYAQWPDEQPYAHVVQVAGDSGPAPQNAAISIPLGEGDRIWMTYDNAEGDMGIVNWTFSVYAQGL